MTELSPNYGRHDIQKNRYYPEESWPICGSVCIVRGKTLETLDEHGCSQSSLGNILKVFHIWEAFSMGFFVVRSVGFSLMSQVQSVFIAFGEEFSKVLLSQCERWCLRNKSATVSS